VIWLYRILLPPFFLLLLPYYLLRMWRRGGYRRQFGNRFGIVPHFPPTRDGVKRIWIQAVSVGELLAAGPLLQRFAREDNVEIILTTTTSTGLRLAHERYGSIARHIGVFPIDFWPFSALAWQRLRPTGVILFESELWPEHLRQAGRRQVPVYLVNARLSERSFGRYFRFRALARPLLRPLTGIFAATPSDKHRFLGLGLETPVLLTGNLKVDFDPEPVLDAAAQTALLRECGFLDEDAAETETPPVVVGASTWPGEEKALVEAWQDLREDEDLENLCLIIVPRHAERAKAIEAELEEILEDGDPPPHFRTWGRPAPAGTRIYVADTTGELRQFLQVATVVFVGKSLPPHTDGQTPIEAAGYGKPLVYGMGMKNFADVATALLYDGAAEMVPDSLFLTEAFETVLQDPAVREERAAAARKWFSANKGAIDRTWEGLQPLLRR
jgi:3-deoxy-D-manno-octulosonic-acid transferase